MSKLDEPMEVEVLIIETLSKVVTALVSSGYPEYECEYDPTTGRRETIGHWVPADVEEEAKGQYKCAYECLRDCALVLPEMLDELNDLRKMVGRKPSKWIQHVDVRELAENCADWELEQETIKER